MAYNSTTGIITAPVSINDVRQALGASSYDLGTLCTMSNINKWSLKKPHFTNDPVSKSIVHIDYDNDIVYYANNATGILAEYLQNPNNDSYAYSFGMRMVSQTDVHDKLSIVDTILSGIINHTRYYEAYQSNLGPFDYPVNKANYHSYLHGYRLTDFDGYNHKAKANSLLGCRCEVKGMWNPDSRYPNYYEEITVSDINSTIDQINEVDNNLKRGVWTNVDAIAIAPKEILNQGYIKIRLETRAEKDSNGYYSLDYVLNKMFGWSPTGSSMSYIYLAVEIRNTSSDSTQHQINSIYSYASSDINPIPLLGGFINNNKTAIRTKIVNNTEYALWSGNSVTSCIPIGRFNALDKKYRFDNSAAGTSSSYIYYSRNINGELEYIDVYFYAQNNSNAPYKFPPFATADAQYREFFEIAINIGWCAPTNGIPYIVNGTTYFPTYGLRKVIRFGN